MLLLCGSLLKSAFHLVIFPHDGFREKAGSYRTRRLGECSTVFASCHIFRRDKVTVPPEQPPHRHPGKFPSLSGPDALHPPSSSAPLFLCVHPPGPQRVQSLFRPSRGHRGLAASPSKGHTPPRTLSRIVSCGSGNRALSQAFGPKPVTGPGVEL